MLWSINKRFWPYLDLVFFFPFKIEEILCVTILWLNLVIKLIDNHFYSMKGKLQRDIQTFNILLNSDY